MSHEPRAPRFPDAPARILALPVDRRGFPVPWFVAWIDGEPDFRVVEAGRFVEAVKGAKCWICGQRLGRFVAFTVGPMCAVNRTSSEPPAHLECARFAAQACPFLSNPRMRRNAKDMPAEAVDPAGEMIARNPGVALVWVSRSFKVWRPPGGGYLVELGEPTSVEWYAHGRPATRAEVEASIESGLPILADMARKDRRPDAALAELQRRRAEVDRLLPRAAA